ncbi:MAG: hypothetical protein KJ666_12095, partial [Bacteroidetes bacterium]|nr:hypothetical protein [Bacteroidota bacterium]
MMLQQQNFSWFSRYIPTHISNWSRSGYSKTSLYLQVLEFPTRFTAYAVHPKDPLEKMGSEVSREPIRNENSVDCVTSV